MTLDPSVPSLSALQTRTITFLLAVARSVVESVGVGSGPDDVGVASWKGGSILLSYTTSGSISTTRFLHEISPDGRYRNLYTRQMKSIWGRDKKFKRVGRPYWADEEGWQTAPTEADVAEAEGVFGLRDIEYELDE